MLTKLKDDILRLLKEDEEFRYAVIGLLGLQRLEEAIARLADSHIELKSIVARLVDIQARQEERLTKLEEAWIRSEERLAKVEERLLRVEERLEEHDRKFNAILEELSVHRAKLEEHDRKFNEIIEEIKDLRRISNEHTKILTEHTNILREHTRRFDDITGLMIHGFDQMRRFAGISLESLVRSILTKSMQERGELPKDKEITSITIDGEEIDVFCDDPLIVGEVTSYADSIDEVYKLVRKGELIRERFKKEPRLILIITNVKREVYEDMVREAEVNGIKIIAGKRV